MLLLIFSILCTTRFVCTQLNSSPSLLLSCPPLTFLLLSLYMLMWGIPVVWVTVWTALSLCPPQRAEKVSVGRKRGREEKSCECGKKEGKTGSPRLAGTFPHSPTLNSTVCVYVFTRVCAWVCTSHCCRVIRQARKSRYCKDCVYTLEGDKQGSQTNFFVDQYQTCFSTSSSNNSSTSMVGPSHWVTHTSPNPIRSEQKGGKKRGFPAKCKHSWCKQSHV